MSFISFRKNHSEGIAPTGQHSRKGRRLRRTSTERKGKRVTREEESEYKEWNETKKKKRIKKKEEENKKKRKKIDSIAILVEQERGKEISSRKVCSKGGGSSHRSRTMEENKEEVRRERWKKVTWRKKKAIEGRKYSWYSYTTSTFLFFFLFLFFYLFIFPSFPLFFSIWQSFPLSFISYIYIPYLFFVGPPTDWTLPLAISEIGFLWSISYQSPFLFRWDGPAVRT